MVFMKIRDIKYVMVTHWKNHWDRIRGNRTRYAKSMVKFNLVEYPPMENAPTLFIKLRESDRRPEGAWIGYVYGFEDKGKNVLFSVKIKGRLPLEEIPEEYRSNKEGWYLVLERPSLEQCIQPPFFSYLRSTRVWSEFEKYVFWLLKLLGIHDVHRFEKQRGKPDGFFVFESLAVIYDCTLEKEFIKSKKQQILNYATQLKSGEIEIETLRRKLRFDVSSRQKQVWIITRGNTRELERIDNVIVKEVSIDKLIELYVKRIKENLGETELLHRLINIA